MSSSARTIDLNADLGEGYGPWKMGDDPAMLRLVSSANVACGGHASDPETMFETMVLARDHGVTVGAHPSYPDREGFGRRRLPCSLGEIERFVAAQVGSLMAIAALAGPAGPTAAEAATRSGAPSTSGATRLTLLRAPKPVPDRADSPSTASPSLATAAQPALRSVPPTARLVPMSVPGDGSASQDQVGATGLVTAPAGVPRGLRSPESSAVVADGATAPHAQPKEGAEQRQVTGQLTEVRSGAEDGQLTEVRSGAEDGQLTEGRPGAEDGQLTEDRQAAEDRQAGEARRLAELLATTVPWRPEDDDILPARRGRRGWRRRR